MSRAWALRHLPGASDRGHRVCTQHAGSGWYGSRARGGLVEGPAAAHLALHALGRLDFKDAHSSEMEPDSPHPVVINMPEISTTHLGGTMRLGKRTTVFVKKDCVTRTVTHRRPAQAVVDTVPKRVGNARIRPRRRTVRQRRYCGGAASPPLRGRDRMRVLGCSVGRSIGSGWAGSVAWGPVHALDRHPGPLRNTIPFPTPLRPRPALLLRGP